jgi:hypothetical protein
MGEKGTAYHGIVFFLWFFFSLERGGLGRKEVEEEE